MLPFFIDCTTTVGFGQTSHQRKFKIERCRFVVFPVGIGQIVEVKHTLKTGDGNYFLRIYP